MTPDRERLDQLAVTWRDPPGLRGFLTTVDHKRIAARYIVTALLLMFLAGMLALDMRLQLSVADNTRMGPQLYNESFSLHGSTMLFLVSVPVMGRWRYGRSRSCSARATWRFPGWGRSVSGCTSAAC